MIKPRKPAQLLHDLTLSVDLETSKSSWFTDQVK